MPNNPQRIVHFPNPRHDDPENLLDHLIDLLSAEKERTSVTGVVVGVEIRPTGHPLDGVEHLRPAGVPLPIGYLRITGDDGDYEMPLAPMTPLAALRLYDELAGKDVAYCARTTVFGRNAQTGRELVLTSGEAVRGDGLVFDVSAWHWL